MQLTVAAVVDHAEADDDDDDDATGDGSSVVVCVAFVWSGKVPSGRRGRQGTLRSSAVLKECLQWWGSGLEEVEILVTKYRDAACSRYERQRKT